MSVKLRERKLAGGRIRYYLDIWHNGKRSYEFLFVVEPKDSKKDKKELAETIARQRAEEIQSQGTSYIPKHKRKTTLHTYLEAYQNNYTKKDINTIKAVVSKIKEFEPSPSFLVNAIDQNFIINFIDYLNNRTGLKGDTPQSYYRRFKKIILQANRDSLINAQVFENIKYKSNQTDSDKTLSKEVLEESEIETLFNTYCGNDEVKKSFLFACYSGIGYAEAKILKWSHIKKGKLRIQRCKVGSSLIEIQLSPTILELIGEPQQANESVFKLSKNGKTLSETAVNKTLKNWIKRAGIDKHITFYCGRHTFAVRLLERGANLKTVADALAHKSTDHTIKYLNHINSLKDNATANL